MDTGGIIAAIIASLAATITGILAAYSAFKKADAERRAKESANKVQELDYLFGQYKETVARVRKEHEDDRTILVALQKEHVECKMEQAAQRERLLVQDGEIKILKDRVTSQDEELKRLRTELAART